MDTISDNRHPILLAFTNSGSGFVALWYDPTSKKNHPFQLMRHKDGTYRIRAEGCWNAETNEFLWNAVRPPATLTKNLDRKRYRGTKGFKRYTTLRSFNDCLRRHYNFP